MRSLSTNRKFFTVTSSLALTLLAASSVIPTTITAQTIELSQLGTVHPGFQINGVDASDRSGISVSGAGDVNGDGLADLIVGARYASPNERRDAGESYVVFGKTDITPVELGALGSGGFQINGIDNYDNSGISVSGAGDVNDDGLADLIVGARGGDPNGSSYAGESYVVFGKTDSAPVELSALDAGGFQINGIDASDYSGSSVSGAGDVNGDGLADLIIGAGGADPSGRSHAGESYVVFGKTDSTPVELSALGTGGFQINGIDSSDFMGYSVSGAGDVNGDGLADLIVGASGADPNGLSSGESYVVFGKADNTAVELSALGTGGFQINGINFRERSGISVSGAGDVNGDGLADLIVGADIARNAAGESYVVFGKTDSNLVELSALGTGGFQINGIDTDDRSGFGVSGTGDVNGDGLADLIIGAYLGDPNERNNAGESYVVFGKTDSAAVELNTLSAGGFQINGIDNNDFSGNRVSGAGDVNGDGLADLIVGAQEADPNGIDRAGESYVIFSTATPPTSATYRSKALGGDAPRVAVGTTGNGSNDSTPDSRTFIDFADGGISASLQTVTLTRSNSSITNLNNVPNVLWEVSTDRMEWTSASIAFKYTDTEITDLRESSLKLFQAVVPSGPWTELTDATLTSSRNQISADVSNFGFFAIQGMRPTTDQWIFLGE